MRKSHVVAVLAAALVGLFGLLAGGQSVVAAAHDVLLMDGYVAVGGDQYGPAVNPATLSWLEDSSVRVEYARGETDSDSSAFALAYFEPDTGLGAGQLAYVSAEMGGQKTQEYVYSASWRGDDNAVGFSVRHVRMTNVPTDPATPPDPAVLPTGKVEPAYTTLPMATLEATAAPKTMTTWTADLGYRGQLGRAVGAGVVVRNVLLAFGDVPRAALPLEVIAGLAFDIGSGLVLAADYVVSNASNLSNAGYHIGLDGRFGQLLARLGRWMYAGGNNLTYVRFGILFGVLRIDASAQHGAGGQTMSLGVSLYF